MRMPKLTMLPVINKIQQDKGPVVNWKDISKSAIIQNANIIKNSVRQNHLRLRENSSHDFISFFSCLRSGKS